MARKPKVPNRLRNFWIQDELYNQFEYVAEANGLSVTKQLKAAMVNTINEHKSKSGLPLDTPLPSTQARIESDAKRNEKKGASS